MEAIADVHRGNSPMSGHIARKVVQYFNLRGSDDKEIEKAIQTRAGSFGSPGAGNSVQGNCRCSFPEH
jgi:hypothetical protein